MLCLQHTITVNDTRQNKNRTYCFLFSSVRIYLRCQPSRQVSFFVFTNPFYLDYEQSLFRLFHRTRPYIKREGKKISRILLAVFFRVTHDRPSENGLLVVYIYQIQTPYELPYYYFMLELIRSSDKFHADVFPHL